jgi:hypothetical protein
MPSVKKLIVPLVLVLMLATVEGVFAQSDEDQTPDVTDRVARISLIRGGVQVRRSDSQDWESAVVNLPLVEGDEITAGSGARVEIQFDAYTYARINESSYLKVTTLKDEGIALSLSEGSLIVRTSEFDKQRSYFEIDAPKTTVAIEKSGMYRIDAGGQNSMDVRAAATDGGEARVYTDTSGFTLRNGRSAQVFIDGANAGEWEAADASRFTDDFATWSLDRDAAIAKRLKDSYYDKYYDRDIYGAEDLDGYGEWIHTSKYGYVWRPYSSAISQYDDWSPYRYGHWRWVPPYGWTWVNDEPWGWATYHHGRWIWDDDHWVWKPYGYNRPRRSWWRPALVVINVFNSNVCWYPLPYNYAYYNFNHNYHHRRGGRGDRDGRHYPPGGGVGPTPTPTPIIPLSGNATNAERRRRLQTPPLSGVPTNGVVMVGEDDFGRNRRTIRRAPPTIANEVIAKKEDTIATPPILPPVEETRSKGKSDTRVEPPIAVVADRKVRTGASERSTGQPLDEQLKKERILGNRPPVTMGAEREGTRPEKQDEPRRTGAVERPPVRRLPPAAEITPAYSPPQKQEEQKVDPPRNDTQPPTVEPRPRRQPPVLQPPVKTDSEAPPPKRETPRNDPPVRREPPQSEQPPRREPPRVEPPQRRDPPPKPPDQPKREEPKPADRPKAPTVVDRKKDGR